MHTAAPSAATTKPAAAAPAWHLFVPKTITVLRQGYCFADLRADLVAGLTVAIVALPLAMALAIASGTTPEKGLVTAVVGGFLASLLGGARFNISGPTGAFVVVVFGVIEKYGYDGLIVATLMAAAMLVAAGVLRLGTWIKYIPEPVVVGFTAGIAVIIFSSQVRDLVGLEISKLPGGVAGQWLAYWDARGTIAVGAPLLSLVCLVVILGLRRVSPRAPGFLIAVVCAAAATALLGLPVETIGSRFGTVSGAIPPPALPHVPLDKLGDLLSPAFTIAFLGGLESLLCAVVADGMTGRRHRSNCELVAQGIANAGSALVGGLPVTGAIARTATAIRAGARSPLTGIFHAVFLFIAMQVAMPLARHIPLAALAAVLVVVAWNMSEQDRVRHILHTAPMGERLVLLGTFGLTVLVDLTTAIEVGVVLSAILFMHGMAEAVSLSRDGAQIVAHDIDDFTRPPDDRAIQIDALPPGVEAFKLSGPLFFGSAGRLADVLDLSPGRPRAFILRMREVPFIDTSGVAALEAFVRRNRLRGTTVIVTGVQPQPLAVMRRMGLTETTPGFVLARDFTEAIAIAQGQATTA